MSKKDVPQKSMGNRNKDIGINMNEIVGTHNILFLCFDTLRWDVAFEEQEKGNTPNINRYGKWEKRHAPGNYTLPSHMAMFTGFFPSPIEPTPLLERGYLFYPKRIGSSGLPNKNSYAFEEATFIQGLEKAGYETMCIGGVGFFDSRTEIGKILPSYFKKSYWTTAFGCDNKNSAEAQIDFTIKKINEFPAEDNIFTFINFTSVHYPNHYFIEGQEEDDKQSHAEALKYIDSQLPRLFESFKNRKPTFVIALSDHGTCYGEDGYHFHCVSNETVYNVPYMQFKL